MRELNDRINELCIKSKRMRSKALDIHGQKGIDLKNEQDKVYKEFLFLKGLRNAINKQNKEVENEDKIFQE